MTNVLCLGDSITHGVYNLTGGITVLTPYGGYRGHLYLSLLARSFAPVMVGRETDPTEYGGHEGYNGYEIRQLYDLVPAIDAAIAAPDYLCLMAGTNDLFGGGTTTSKRANALPAMKDLLALLRQTWPDVVMLVSTIPRTNVAASNELVDAYNASLPLAVAGQAALIEPPLVYPDDLYDGVHPNDGGYQKIADAFYAAILEIDARDRGE